MRFTQAAKDFQVRKLPESVNDLDNNDDIPNEGIRKDNEDQAENELHISNKLKSRMGLYLHTSSAHDGIGVSTSSCDCLPTHMHSAKALCNTRVGV